MASAELRETVSPDVGPNTWMVERDAGIMPMRAAGKAEGLLGPELLERRELTLPRYTQLLLPVSANCHRPPVPAAAGARANRVFRLKTAGEGQQALAPRQKEAWKWPGRSRPSSSKPEVRPKPPWPL